MNRQETGGWGPTGLPSLLLWVAVMWWVCLIPTPPSSLSFSLPPLRQRREEFHVTVLELHAGVSNWRRMIWVVHDSIWLVLSETNQTLIGCSYLRRILVCWGRPTLSLPHSVPSDLFLFLLPAEQLVALTLWIQVLYLGVGTQKLYKPLNFPFYVDIHNCVSAITYLSTLIGFYHQTILCFLCVKG